MFDAQRFRIDGEARATVRVQARRVLPTAAVTLVSLAVLLALVEAFSIVTGTSVKLLTEDPLATAQLNPLTGAVSNLGVMLWSMTAGLTFLTASVLRAKGATREAAAFFLWSGVLTVVLLLDDQFELHEVIGPQWLHVPQRGIYLVYVAMTGAYLWRFRRVLLRFDYLLLVLAGTFFAMSIALDVVHDTWEITFPVHNLLEDGSKLLGIALWLVFFGRSAFASLAPAISPQMSLDASPANDRPMPSSSLR